MRIPRPLQRRSLCALAALVALSSAAMAEPASPAPANPAKVHADALVLDSHVDVLLPGSDAAPLADLPQLKAGGVDAVVLALFAATGPDTDAGRTAALKTIDDKLAAIHALAEAHPDQAALAYSAADVRRIAAQGKVAILISALNTYALGHDLDGLDRLQQKGVRVLGLVHAGNTAFADSSRPRPGEGAPNGGLSDLGRAAISRLNDLGVLVDVSQLTPQGVLQAVALSRAPVAATHSDVRALVDHPRNLSDAEIDAIAARGGVIQVTPFTAYLTVKPADYDQRLAALRTAYGLPAGSGDQGVDVLPRERRATFMTAFRALYPRATLAAYVDHIDYIAKRVGVEHVGIGSDFNHGAGITGFKDESEAPNVTEALLARGYTPDQIKLIWGGNFLRVLEAAEAQKKP